MTEHDMVAKLFLKQTVCANLSPTVLELKVSVGAETETAAVKRDELYIQHTRGCANPRSLGRLHLNFKCKTDPLYLPTTQTFVQRVPSCCK